MTVKVATTHTTEGGYWGHHVEWLDYKKGRVWGHLRRRPKVGELLTSPLQSGRTGVFRFTEVELCRDPMDMFFGTVEPLGYEDELDMAELESDSSETNEENLMSVTHIGQELYTIVSRSSSLIPGNDVVEDLATLAEVLENLDTLGVGQVCDRKIDENGFRVFLSRCGLADGEPFENTVYLEEYDEEQGRWIDVGYFDGDVLFHDLKDTAFSSFGTRSAQ